MKRRRRSVDQAYSVMDLRTFVDVLERLPGHGPPDSQLAPVIHEMS